MFDYFSWIHDALPFLRTAFGATLFVPLYAIWVTLLLPGVWASMLAGALYGPWLGSVLVFFGAVIGAEVAFWLGRTLLRDWTRRRLARFPKLLSLEKAVSSEGLRLVLLTRLSPAFPFSLLNLAYGLSGISFRDYTFGLVGILPGTILFCGLGSLAGDIARFNELLTTNNSLSAILIRLTGLIATLAVVWLVSRAARRALQETESSL